MFEYRHLTMEDISWESVQKWWFTNNNGDLAFSHQTCGFIQEQVQRGAP